GISRIAADATAKAGSASASRRTLAAPRRRRRRKGGERAIASVYRGAPDKQTIVQGAASGYAPFLPPFSALSRKPAVPFPREFELVAACCPWPPSPDRVG